MFAAFDVTVHTKGRSHDMFTCDALISAMGLKVSGCVSAAALPLNMGQHQEYGTH